MSSLHEVRWRLRTEQLEALADWLSGEERPVPEEVEEQAVRLLAAAALLLGQHEVNKRGQCKFCGWTRWKWRFWHRRPRCTVFQALDRAMREELDVVWWELFAATGREVSLEEVREWVDLRATDTA
ncbi:MAG: hypothetical protein ACRDSP_06095 [Pseudonocardiaceae bacterium]